MFKWFRKKRSRYIPKAIRRAVRKRDGNKCRQCGCRTQLQFDHRWPFSKGGKHTVDNLQLLCRRCNLRKHDKLSWWVWLQGRDG